MQKFGALVSSSLNRLALEQDSVDVTYTSLSSLRKTRESWENLHNRPARSPQLGSPSDILPVAASDRTGVRSSNTPEVEHIERWLKDVTAALERENETIKDARTQQAVRCDSARKSAGSPLPLHQNEALQAAAAKLQESQAELLTQQERVQVRPKALDRIAVQQQRSTSSHALCLLCTRQQEQRGILVRRHGSPARPGRSPVSLCKHTPFAEYTPLCWKQPRRCCLKSLCLLVCCARVLKKITAARQELERSSAGVSDVLGEIRTQNHHWRQTTSPDLSQVVA